MPSLDFPLRAARAGFRIAVCAALGACGGDDGGGPVAVPDASTDAGIVRAAAQPITGAAGDYDPLLAMVGGDTRLVFLGDATHGTHEFYAERARVTQRLVAERDFSGVAIEGDWPDAYRVNEYVRGLGADRSAEEALSSFDRFPEWMWRNADVRDLVRWLREYNAGRPAGQRVGFYGLDVQNLYEPIDAVLRFLDASEPAAAARVRALYACFDPYRPDPGADRYGRGAAQGGSCEAQVRGAVAEVERAAGARPADHAAAEARFSALRHAHAVANAESYFRSAYAGTSSSWNLRDSLMDVTLEATLQHLGAAAGRPARVVVWAHNTHSGDARHTAMGAQGELNIGQLARQRYGAAALLAGFFTYTGTVYAATDWGRSGQRREVNRALAGSYSALFHETALPSFVLALRGGGPAAERLAGPRLERAIGVIYRPETERESHYFTARLAAQFDAVAFFDVTSAVTPLAAGAAAATFPPPFSRAGAMLRDR
jgi:erythromycin esterase-like protein